MICWIKKLVINAASLLFVIDKRGLLLAFGFLLSSCQDSSNHFQGYVETQYVYLSAPYSGVLKELTVVRGDHIKKGQLIFKLDPNPQDLMKSEAESSLMQAQYTLDDLIAPKRPAEIDGVLAQIKQAEAQIRLAELRVKRNQTLVSKHALDQDTLDSSIEHLEETKQLKAQYDALLALYKQGSRENQIKAQQFQVNAMNFKLMESKWQLDQKTMIAPMDAYVFDTYFTVGEFVDASHPVLSLLVPANIRIDFFVPAVVVPSLHLGQRFTVYSEDGSQKYYAKISYISSLAEYVPPLVYSRDNLDKLVFRIKAIPCKPMSLKPGQPVEIVLHTPNTWHKVVRRTKKSIHDFLLKHGMIHATR